MSDTAVGVTRVFEIDVKASANAAAHLKQIADGMGGVEKTAKQTQDSVGSFFDFFKNSAKGLAGIFVVGEVTKMVMAVNELNDTSKILMERMKLVTGSSRAAGDAFLEITRIARDQGREIDGVAKLYEKASRNAEALGITTRGVSSITEGFAASLRLSGSSTQEANAAMIQFGQVLASGRFQGDEFRSMMENNSVFMFELAKAAGVTMDALRKMSKDGKLNSEFLREALFKLGDDGKTMLQRLQEKAEALPKTFAQAVDGGKAAFVELLSAMNTTAGHAEGLFTRMVKAVSEGISNAARIVRENTMIENEILKSMGKGTETKPTEELDFNTQRNLDLFARQGSAERRIIEETSKMNKYLAAGMSETDVTITRLVANIKRAEGEVKGIQAVLDEYARRQGLKTTPFLQDGWKPAPEDPKKDKKALALDDPIDKMLDDLKEEQRKIEYDLENLGKRAQKAEEAIMKTSLDTDKSVTKGMIEDLRRVAKELDTRDFNINLSKDVASYIKDVLKDNETQMKKEIDDYFGRLNKYLAMGRRKDPIKEMEHDLEEIDKLIADSATGPDQIADLIEAKAAIRLAAMEKIFGKEVTLVKSTADQFKEVWSGAWDTMIDDLLEFDKSSTEILEDFVKNFLKGMAKIQMQKMMQPLMESSGTAVSSFFASLFASANGSAFTSGGTRMFANGGVVSSPTAFQYNGGQQGVMGEAGPEAIMPLRRGADGKLGVSAPTVSVTVNNNSGKVQATPVETTDRNGNREIIIMVEDIVDNALGGGRFDATLRSTHGISRRGK